MEEKLGAISLSQDILNKAEMGLWAFELDEGKAPRMYVNDKMLSLIGLDKQISPEETYHAWYDHVDKDSYDLINKTVEKMSNGEHAEVQYPWHYANGKTIIVRCGGKRNYSYKNGIRIEGTHQDVTSIAHYGVFNVDEETRLKRELEVQEKEKDTLIKALLKDYNRVIYVKLGSARELDVGTILLESKQLIERFPEFAKEEYFYKQIAWFAKKVVKKEERNHFIELTKRDVILKKISRGQDYNVEFKVDFNDEIHDYMLKFSPVKSKGNEYGFVCGLKNQDVEKQAEKDAMQALESKKLLDSFASLYNTVFTIDVKNRTCKFIKLRNFLVGNKQDQEYDAIKVINSYIDQEVYELDRRKMRHEMSFSNFKQRIKDEKTYVEEYRAYIDGVAIWHEMYVTSLGEDVVLVGCINKDNEILIRHINKELQSSFEGIYVVNFESNQMKIMRSADIVQGIDSDVVNYTKIVNKFAKLLKKKDREFFESLSNIDYAKELLSNDNKVEYVFFAKYNKEPDWVKFTMQTLTIKDGEASTAFMTISPVDALQKKAIQSYNDVVGKLDELED